MTCLLCGLQGKYVLVCPLVQFDINKTHLQASQWPIYGHGQKVDEIYYSKIHHVLLVVFSYA